MRSESGVGSSPAVEVAAYRIVMEALANAARHSGCDSATVRLQADGGALVIDVTDGGTSNAGSSNGAWSTGVGIASMRERAARLVGTLSAGIGATVGRVHGVLPLS